jgi:nitrite reductase/ring-hydroxylating ferredoxin subunit
MPIRRLMRESDGTHPFVRVAQSEDVPEGGVHGVRVGSDRLCLVRVGGELFALEDVCPHQGYPLSSGSVMDGQLECPWHGALFDCRSGAVRQGPATDALATWDVREVHGFISIGARRASE